MMIFQDTWQQVLDGTQTQLHVLVKPGENLYYAENDVWNAVVTSKSTNTGDPHIKWQVGQTYAVQPGHGQRAVGRIRITHIRQEALQSLTPEDIWDEGIRLLDYVDVGPLDIGAPDEYDYFEILWDNDHTEPGTQWKDNPDVFVLTFELVLEADNGEITQA